MSILVENRKIFTPHVFCAAAERVNFAPLNSPWNWVSALGIKKKLE